MLASLPRSLEHSVQQEHNAGSRPSAKNSNCGGNEHRTTSMYIIKCPTRFRRAGWKVLLQSDLQGHRLPPFSSHDGAQDTRHCHRDAQRPGLQRHMGEQVGHAARVRDRARSVKLRDQVRKLRRGGEEICGKELGAWRAEDSAVDV